MHSDVAAATGAAAPSLEDQEPPFTRTQKDELLLLMFSILCAANGIIEAAIEGRPLSALRVQEYYGAWTELMTVVDHGHFQGLLISAKLIDDIEARCKPATARPATEAASNTKEA